MAHFHLGGHPSQGHVHGVRHVWADSGGAHLTTFWFDTEQRARDEFQKIADECRQTAAHKHMELIINGVATKC